MPYRTVVWHTVGRPFKKATQKWKPVDRLAFLIFHSDFLMEHVRNYLSEAVICCSNLLINGTKSKRKGQKSSLQSIPILKQLTHCHIRWEWSFQKNTIKDAARLSMARWYNKVEESGMKQFHVIASTFYEHYDEILNFYNNRSSNAAAESFNAKIKLFRANLHGVSDKKFFLFRIAKLYGYPY